MLPYAGSPLSGNSEAEAVAGDAVRAGLPISRPQIDLFYAVDGQHVLRKEFTNRDSVTYYGVCCSKRT